MATPEQFIGDNVAEDWKALRYVREWCDISSSIDIATGHFEIGALPALDGAWRRVDRIRLLVGGETSRSTADAVAAGLDTSIDVERQTGDALLTGVDAVVDGIRSGQIEIRVYDIRAVSSPRGQVRHQVRPRLRDAARRRRSALGRTERFPEVRRKRYGHHPKVARLPHGQARGPRRIQRLATRPHSPHIMVARMETELIEIVAAIKETLAIVPDGVALLEEIIAGPLITAEELPAVPDPLRQPPKTKPGGMADAGLF